MLRHAPHLTVADVEAEVDFAQSDAPRFVDHRRHQRILDAEMAVPSLDGQRRLRLAASTRTKLSKFGDAADSAEDAAAEHRRIGVPQ